MKCPKCSHQWTAARKAKGPEWKHSGTFAVFEQGCTICSRIVDAGERVWAATRLPFIVCSEHSKPRGTIEPDSDGEVRLGKCCATKLTKKERDRVGKCSCFVEVEVIAYPTE